MKTAMQIVVGCIFLLACVQAVSATDISGATDITASGVYNLTTDLSGAHISNQYTFGINSSDVILDGGGHTIDEGGAGIFTGIEKVWSDPPHTNITIRNLNVHGYILGISTMMMNQSSIENVRVSSSGHIGILMDGSDNCAVRDSSVSTSQTFEGVQVMLSNGVIFENVTVLDNAGPGIHIMGGSGNAVLNSTVTGNSALTDEGGVVFDTVLGGAIINTTFSSNRFDAVNLTNSSDNVISQNRMSDHLGAGAVIYQGEGASVGNLVQKNTIVNNHQGVVLDGIARGNVTGNNIINNTFKDIAGLGYFAAIRIKAGQNNTASGNTVLNCSGPAFLLEDAVGNLLVQNLTDCNVAAGVFKLDFLTEQRYNRFTVPDYLPFQDYITLWNGTTIPANPGKVWYFFNETQSPSGMNMAVNLTVLPSIPLAGNITIRLNTTNLTADPLDWSTPWWDQYSGQNGMTGGRITNTTQNITFTGHDPLVPDNPSMVLPVEFTYGENIFNGVPDAFTHDYAVIVNYNPPVDAPALAAGTSYNRTESTNWTTIPDFTAAKPIFVVDNTSTGVILGNVTFITPVNLTNQSFCLNLASMGQALSFAAAGNVIGFNMGNPGIRATMNASARLTMYPNGFTFTNPSDLVLVTVPDGGVSVQVWTGPGGWATGAGNYINTGSLVAQDGKVTFDSLHFSAWACDKAGPGPGTVKVTGISPTSAPAGSTVMATITGANFTANLSTRANLTAGGNVIEGTTSSATTSTLKATFIIPVSAPQGLWDITVTNYHGSSGTKPGAFTVMPPLSPTISSISPNSGLKGKTVSLILTGTNFTPGSIVNLTQGCDGIQATNVVATGGKKITCKAAIPAGAATGPYNVTVINNLGQAGSLPGGFAVLSGPAPTISSLTPNTMYPNTTWNFTLAGTNFQAGAAVTFNHPTFGPLPATASVTDPKKITGNLTFPLSGTTGKWDLTVINPDEGTTTKKNALTVKPWDKPAVTSVLPSTVLKNATTTMVLNGKNFEAGLTAVFFNLTGKADIPLTNLTFVSPGKVTGDIVVPSGPVDGKWNAVVTTADGGTSVRSNALIIRNWTKPTISTVTPSKAFVNSTVPFTIGGTSFQDGAVVFFNRTGSADTLIPTSYTVVSTKKIAGTLLLLNSTAPVKWNLVITTPDGGTTVKSNAFQVTLWPKPTAGTITPASGTAGTPVTFNLTGTNFQADATAVIFNKTGSPDVPATGITVLSQAKLTGTVTLPATGTWNLFVTTVDGGTSAKKSSAFTAK